jgi:hypothetical protein
MPEVLRWVLGQGAYGEGVCTRGTGESGNGESEGDVWEYLTFLIEKIILKKKKRRQELSIMPESQEQPPK